MLLAQSLLHKLGADEYKGELLCLLAQLKCYVEPMQAACGMWLDAEAAATKAGGKAYDTDALVALLHTTQILTLH